MVLPRQFQVLVVENVDERHLKKAMWLFPLYLLLINIFVLPIAFAGLLQFPQGGVDADTFVLTVPMKEQQPLLALIAFIGGLSAATGMIIVETVALATMVCNDLVMPLLLRVGRLHLSERRDLTGILLTIRRGTIILVVLLGYAYVRLIGESYALVTIGLVSFVGGDAVRAGDHRRHLLEGRDQGRRARRRSPADSWCGSTRCCCRPSRARAGSPRASSRMVRSALRCSSRTRCSAWTGSTRSRMPRSGRCWSMSACSSGSRWSRRSR